VTLTLPEVIDRPACEQLDAEDSIAWARDRFQVDDSIIYLDGNSLGRLGIDVAPQVRHLIEDGWGNGLVRSWTDCGWMESPLRVGSRIAGLIGARPDEVLVTDSTTVALFKLTTAVLNARP